MDSSRGGKSQNREEKKKGQKKEDLDARIGRKVAKRYVFPLPVAPEGQKVGSLKRRVRELRDQKLHAVVGRSTFEGSQNVKTTSGSEIEMWQKCTPLWCEAHDQAKRTKHTMFGALLEAIR